MKRQRKMKMSNRKRKCETCGGAHEGGVEQPIRRLNEEMGIAFPTTQKRPYEGEPRLANCGTSLTMDKDSSEGEPRMDYYPKMHLDVYVRGEVW